MKLLIRSPYDTLSGFGNDGCGMAMAFADKGIDVHLSPTVVGPPIPEQVARLFMKYPDPPFDATIVHMSPIDKEFNAHVFRGASHRMIGWTMYEFTRIRLPGWEFVAPRFAETKYDLLLAYDEVTQEALVDPAINTTSIPVHLLQGGYTPDFWQQADQTKRDWSGTFKFGMVGRLHRRKNPWAAIQAFSRLKALHGDRFDAELHLKTTMPDLPRGDTDSGIHVYFEWWTALRLRQFYESIHCLLAPSQGEGKNLPALEAMTTGVPVIATDFGGHRGWLSSEYAYAIRHGMKDFTEGPAADPDVDHLTELMWRVYTRRDEARMKGEIASRTLPSMLSWAKVTDRFLDVMNHWPVGDAGDRRVPEAPTVPAALL